MKGSSIASINDSPIQSCKNVRSPKLDSCKNNIFLRQSTLGNESDGNMSQQTSGYEYSLVNRKGLKYDSQNLSKSSTSNKNRYINKLSSSKRRDNQPRLLNTPLQTSINLSNARSFVKSSMAENQDYEDLRKQTYILTSENQKALKDTGSSIFSILAFYKEIMSI